MDWIPESLIKVLNAIGLPILTYAIIVMYRTLMKRTTFLQSSMKDMKDVYDSVIDTARKRSVELEASIDGQKKFNELYLQMVVDSSDHIEKVKEWKRSEVVILEERMNSMASELHRAGEMIKDLKNENKELRGELQDLKNELDELNQNMGPGESMARSQK